jgi:hypothetical protein
MNSGEGGSSSSTNVDSDGDCILQPEDKKIKLMKPISDYFNKCFNNSDEILARMVAKDGIPFSVFVTF